LVEVKTSFILDRPLGAGLGAGTCPTEQQEFSVMNGSLGPIWPPPKRRVWGRGSAQLEERENVNKKVSLRQSENFFHF
jgi:hypothetical protein